MEQEKIIIKNSDFSVLKGLKSVNKWGYKTKIEYTSSYNYISIYVYEKNGISMPTLIHTNNVSDKYIIENLTLQGFEIEFEDAREINTIEEVLEFLKQNTNFALKYNANLEMLIVSTSEDLVKFWTTEKIEKEYNVKLNILRGE